MVSFKRWKKAPKGTPGAVTALHPPSDLPGRVFGLLPERESAAVTITHGASCQFMRRVCAHRSPTPAGVPDQALCNPHFLLASAKPLRARL